MIPQVCGHYVVQSSLSFRACVSVRQHCCSHRRNRLETSAAFVDLPTCCRTGAMLSVVHLELLKRWVQLPLFAYNTDAKSTYNTDANIPYVLAPLLMLRHFH